MSTETLEVAKREGVGSTASRKLRQTGNVPAILYGHGEDNVNLSVSHDAISRIVHHGTKLLSLTGAVTETALLRDVQWDSFGIDVLHVDFTRVSQSESVEVTLPVELQGEAPGISAGGKLSFPSHEVTIRCAAASIPESLKANIGELNIGQAVHASDLELPEGASLVTPATDVIVQVSKPAGAKVDDDTEDTGASEPEVIAKGKGDEEDSE